MFNNVVLTGRLTAEPELKKTPSDISVCSFVIACERPFKKGEEKVSDFIHIVTWRNTAEFVCKYFGKGDLIGIEGRIQSRNYEDKDGNKRNTIEVVAKDVQFVTPKNKAQSESNGDMTEISSDDELPFD